VSRILRAGTVDDLHALLAIEKASFSNPHWKARHFLRYECTVADVDGKIAGFLIAHDIFPGNGEARPEREILNLAVAPASRRQGIASLLLEHELQRPATHFLEVRESNLAAQALYQRFGFERVGIRRDYYSHPRESAIVMKRF
jgi:ribosomal-protein-alanine acetyltransferase